MSNLLRENNVHILAVVNDDGIPQDSDTLNPSAHLSVDANGNLRTSATAIIPGSVEISNDVGNPVPVSGTVEITNDVGNPIPVNGTVTANAGVGPWPVTDNGGSLTVDGPLTDAELRATPVPISAATLPLPTGAATAALQTQPGVDIGDVTVNNAGGAAAVNIQDGGNSITTDTLETETTPTQIIKTVALTTVPEALAANGTFFKTATLIANNAARTPNTGKVWLGVTAGDGTQTIGLDSGDVYEINAPAGQKYDLNDWYLDVETAADGVVVIYS